MARPDTKRSFVIDKPVSDDEVCRWVEKLNAFYHVRKWEITHAQKEHTDEHGVTIREGEYYFRLTTGFKTGMKYSFLSMYRLIQATIMESEYLRRLADVLLEEQRNKLKGTTDCLQSSDLREDRL